MVSGIGNSGQGGSNSGKLRRAFFPMRKLLDSARTPEHEQRYRRLVRKVNDRHGVRGEKIQQITDLVELKDFVLAEIKKLFSPKLVSFTKERSLAKAAKIALAENRTIYIPSRGSSNVFVSGQPPKESTEVFEAQASQLGVDTDSLPNGCESAVILPLVSPAETRHGAILLGKDKPNGFDPQTDLRALRMIANDMAIVLSQTGQSL